MRQLAPTIGVLAVLAGGSERAFAQQLSESAEISARDTLEVETGYVRSHGDSGLVNTAVALVRYSISDALRVEIGTDNLVAVQRGAATALFDGVYFGPKLVVLPQTEHRPAVAVSAVVALPTHSGPDALIQTADTYLWGYLSKDLLGVHADLNLGFDVLSVDTRPAIQLVAAAAVSRALSDDFGAALELYTCEGGGMYEEHDAGALAALSYTATPWLTVQAGADMALYRDVRSLTLFAGVTVVPHQRARADDAGAARGPPVSLAVRR